MRIKIKKVLLFFLCVIFLLVTNLFFRLLGNDRQPVFMQNFICKNGEKTTTENLQITETPTVAAATTTQRSLAVTNPLKQSFIYGNIYVDKETSISDSITSLQNQIFSPLTKTELRQLYTEEIDIITKFNTTKIVTRDMIKTIFPHHDGGLTVHSSDRIIRQLNLKANHIYGKEQMKSALYHRDNLKKKKRILVYFRGSDLNEISLTKNKCEINNCQFLQDINRIEYADVVVFNYIPPKLRRPKNRPDQLWIYFQLESPINTGKPQSLEQVNWTATYRSDSVLNTPYEKFSTNPIFTNLPKDNILSKNFAKGKTKLAAWFVSNCGATNGRMDYVKELMKYARVDVYGYCGTLQCNRYDKSCFQLLKDDYKFYLAFENSNCRDYITEKFFWNALNNDVVPVVMGAHPDDYKRIAPPNSYIHVDQFHSPRALAEYLHIVDLDDDLYNSYFRWKNTGEFINTKFVCRLCAMVNIADSFPMSYPNLGNWWAGKDICVKAKRGLWASWKNITAGKILKPDFKF